jgi:hypothetical protein
MALHVFVFVFLLVVCLLLSLALLWRLDWFSFRPSHSREGAKRSTLHRLYWLLGICVLKYDKLGDCPFTFFDTMTIFSLHYKPFSKRMSQVG